MYVVYGKAGSISIICRLYSQPVSVVHCTESQRKRERKSEMQRTESFSLVAFIRKVKHTKRVPASTQSTNYEITDRKYIKQPTREKKNERKIEFIEKKLY